MKPMTRLDVRDFAVVFLDANVRRLRQQWQEAIDQRKPARTIAAALAAYQEAREAAQQVQKALGNGV